MKKILPLLLVLMIAPVWAADTAPAPTTGDASAPVAKTAPKHKAKKHKAKKAETTNATMSSTPATACYKLTCKGVTGCFTKGCMGPCTGCI